MNSILNISEKYAEDDSISNYETYAFYPITGTQLNNPGSITITVQNSDNFYHPHRSWLQFEGVLQKASDGGNYTAAQLITLTNNGIMYLFDNVKYLLSSTEIESVFNPGAVSNMMGLAKYPSSFKGLNQCWDPDTSNAPAATNTGYNTRHGFIFSSNPIGTFRFAIPLSHIFGFCEDYEKVVYGMVHTLVLTRSSTDSNALFKQKDTMRSNENVPDGAINLKNIRWMLPRVSPSDVARYELLKQIKAEIILSVGYRMSQCITTSVPDSNQFTWRLGVRSSPEQPRYILLAFQTDRAEDQQMNSATYDNLGVTNAHVLLNNDRYPMNDFETDYTLNHYDQLYYNFQNFINLYYKVDPMVTSTGIGPVAFKSLYPILVFDVSKQSERLKTGVTDITLQVKFTKNPAKNTMAHALIISDRKLRFKSDGEKMSVLF